jgi:osmotically-inducible protein OsmY
MWIPWDGVVALSGLIESNAEIKRAEGIAGNTGGVVKVIGNLKTATP